MAKIEKLTPEQLAAVPEFRDKWFKIGTSTQPADRPKAEAALTKMYAAIGRERPTFLWCDSPLTANVLIHLLKTEAVAKLDEIIVNTVVAQEQMAFPKEQSTTTYHIDCFRDMAKGIIGAIPNSFKDQPYYSLQNLADLILSTPVLDPADQVAKEIAKSEPTFSPPTYSTDLRQNVLGWFKEHITDATICETPPNFWGSQDAYWVAFYKFCEEILGIEYDKVSSQRLDWHADIVKSCMWIWSFEDVCICCERPTKLQIIEDRLHCNNSFAISFPDGWAVYVVKGVRIPHPYIVEHPEQITVEAIESERNAEVRRVMIENYGQARYLLDSGATEIHRDDWGILYRKEVPDDEPLVMVKVANSTPEPDGSFKDYFIRVHPELRPMLRDKTLGEPQEMTARNAVASTFGKTGREYNPDVET